MGTRGSFGIVVNGELKIGYNQFDSYPEGWGIDTLRWLRRTIEDGQEDKVKAEAATVKVVNEDIPPTEEDIGKLSLYTDLQYSSRSTDDWYCLTHKSQGSIEKMIDCGYILDASTFPLDSLYCEWAYMVDFDNRQFEVYEGWNLGKASKGRWANLPYNKTTGYGAVDLKAIYHFDSLPTDDNFLIDMGCVVIEDNLV